MHKFSKKIESSDIVASVLDAYTDDNYAFFFMDERKFLKKKFFILKEVILDKKLNEGFIMKIATDVQNANVNSLFIGNCYIVTNNIYPYYEDINGTINKNAVSDIMKEFASLCLR